MNDRLTHIDAQGKARMVDVTDKPQTHRIAIAQGCITMQPATMHLLLDDSVPKGDVIAAARLAGIMAAKRTGDLIPLCHPLGLNQVDVEFDVIDESSQIIIRATCKCFAPTGVEMEALCAVSVAALTLYDMLKARDKTMKINDIHLLHKSGGRSGDFNYSSLTP